MKPDAVLAIHISNRYLDLEPVVAEAAQEMGWTGVIVTDDGLDQPKLLFGIDLGSALALCDNL